jgi:UDP-2,4-diacetamido-2,4,6-trideoxy-beta-L-altropyranose hydrolase
MGMGHLMRCMTLADQLEAAGRQVVFLCAALPPETLAWVRQIRGKAVHLMDVPHGTEADIQAVTAYLQSSGGCDWFVVDHYQWERRHEEQVRHYANRVLVIDDLANRLHAADLLLDQNLFAEATTRYAGKIEAHCQTLLGPQYALLRAEFAEQRSMAWPDRNGPVQRILISFGGNDRTNETAKALHALDRLGQSDYQIDVLIGNANPHRQVLDVLCKQFTDVTLHVQTEQMAQRMAHADLAIGAGGITTWERCCMGLPALVMATAENQVEPLLCLSQLGVLSYLGCAEAVTVTAMAEALQTLLHSPGQRALMSEKSGILVDGQGVKRVMSAMGSMD